MWNLKNNINKTDRLTDTVKGLIAAGGGLDEKVKTGGQVQASRDVKCGIGTLSHHCFSWVWGQRVLEMQGTTWSSVCLSNRYAVRPKLPRSDSVSCDGERKNPVR